MHECGNYQYLHEKMRQRVFGLFLRQGLWCHPTEDCYCLHRTPNYNHNLIDTNTGHWFVAFCLKPLGNVIKDLTFFTCDKWQSTSQTLCIGELMELITKCKHFHKHKMMQRLKVLLHRQFSLQFAMQQTRALWGKLQNSCYTLQLILQCWEK